MEQDSLEVRIRRMVDGEGVPDGDGTALSSAGGMTIFARRLAVLEKAVIEVAADVDKLCASLVVRDDDPPTD